MDFRLTSALEINSGVKNIYNSNQEQQNELINQNVNVDIIKKAKEFSQEILKVKEKGQRRQR